MSWKEGFDIAALDVAKWESGVEDLLRESWTGESRGLEAQMGETS